MAVNWSKADEISDRIIDLVNQRVKEGCDPISIYVGQLLGLVGFMRTSPRENRPESMDMVLESAMDALMELHEFARRNPAVKAVIEKPRKVETPAWPAKR